MRKVPTANPIEHSVEKKLNHSQNFLFEEVNFSYAVGFLVSLSGLEGE